VDVTTWQFGGDDQTVELYVNRAATGSDYYYRFFEFTGDATGSNTGEYDSLNMMGDGESDTINFRCYSASTHSGDLTTPSFDAAAWVHVVATLDHSAATSTFYINGIETNDRTSSESVLRNMERARHGIGCHPGGWTLNPQKFFAGTIAYLRFWHGQALDADQVAELYAARIEPTPAPTGAVAPTP
jgi:hypothetical protein